MIFVCVWKLQWMDKIKIVADFKPDLSECTLHLFSYDSLHDCIVLINFCYTALGLLFQSCLKWKPRNWAKAVGDTLSQGKVSPPSCHVCFHVYVMLKGLRRAWLFEVSESPSRGYWKQFLLSRPYGHRIDLQQRGDTLPRGKVSPPQPSCMLSFLCYDKGIEKSLVIWSFWKFFKRILETIYCSYLVPMNTVRIYM